MIQNCEFVFIVLRLRAIYIGGSLAEPHSIMQGCNYYNWVTNNCKIKYMNKSINIILKDIEKKNLGKINLQCDHKMKNEK